MSPEHNSNAEFDRLTHVLEAGVRAKEILTLGVGQDLDRHRLNVIRQAEFELRDGKLTPDRAMIHIACANALRAYREELESSVRAAESAAQKLAKTPEDG